MRNLTRNPAWLLLPFLLAGCASTQSRFEKVTPAMNSDEVVDTMNAGPTRFENLPGTTYQRWFFGKDDFCVLFRDGKVISKDMTHTGMTTSTAFGGTYTETSPARCLAPGQVATSDVSRTVNIPGVGTIRIPGESHIEGGAKPSG